MAQREDLLLSSKLASVETAILELLGALHTLSESDEFYSSGKSPGTQP
jgi:hypothetical protein